MHASLASTRSIRLRRFGPGSAIRSLPGKGDTLVVESTNFRPGTQGRGGTENLKVTERFSWTEGGVRYRFTVEDPTVWTAPWTGEYLWRPTEEKVYEYACHEGNYALGTIMRGARLLEREALEKREAESDR